MTINEARIGVTNKYSCAILGTPEEQKKEKNAKNQQKQQFHDPQAVRQQVVTLTVIQSDPPAITTARLSKGDPMTTKRNHNKPSNRTIQTKKHQDEYVIGVYQALAARLGNHSKYKGQEVADVIQYTIIELLGRISFIMGKYPDPAHYVGARLSNVVTDYGRRQAAQRGEGARFDRIVGSANDEHTARKIEQFANGDSFDVADNLDKIALVQKVKSVLTAEEQRIFNLVYVKGLSVTEVAKIVGKRRETVSRSLSDAKKRAQKAIGPAS
ncbi:MAG: sigma-70 family RNA polymerase sigma factor [Actinobacteria bacterium]|nr:sigma-70 family RNA polymerase sigma factor [Actinomycetota bacterium]